jgi:uncharacterized protein YbaR (Trm112 family)
MQSWLLELIQCPITREPLHEASAELLQSLRTRILERQLINRLGMQVTEQFESGLVNQSLSWFYPVTKGYPNLLPDEAIGIS